MSATIIQVDFKAARNAREVVAESEDVIVCNYCGGALFILHECGHTCIGCKTFSDISGDIPA
jgi:hypothetical protein